MIQLTRSLARQLWAVFRRCVPRPLAAQRPIVVLQAGADGLHVHLTQAEVSAEYHQRGSLLAASLAVPLETLALFEGRGHEAVTLESSRGKVVARWQDRGMPQLKECEAADVARLPPFPALPDRLVANPPSLLKALEDAAGCTDAEGVRYATQFLQLRGKAGEVVATDGKQLFLHGGFRFPWEDNPLVPRLGALGGREFPRDGPVEVGRAAEHVAVRVGPWAFFLKVDAAARYPAIDEVIPRASAEGTRWHLAPEDAAFLASALPHLPGHSGDPSPVTVDLNGRVCFRTREEGGGRVTEVLLARSGHTGKAVRLCVNRKYLVRALALGLTEVFIPSPDRPVLCSGGGCRYVVMPLDKVAALDSTDDAVHITSLEKGAVPQSPTPEKKGMPAATSTLAVVPAPRKREKRWRGKDGEAGAGGLTQEEAHGGLGALVEEAAALKALLRDAAVRAGKLLDAVKRHRRQSRLVAATLASLRQLQHIGG